MLFLNQKFESLFTKCLIVMVLMVFLTHFYMVKYKGMSPWNGGGFGMFSYLERGQDFACLYVDYNGVKHRVSSKNLIFIQVELSKSSINAHFLAKMISELSVFPRPSKSLDIFEFLNGKTLINVENSYSLINKGANIPKDFTVIPVNKGSVEIIAYETIINFRSLEVYPKVVAKYAY